MNTTGPGRLLLLALVLAEVVSATEASMIYGAMRVLTRDFGDPVAVGWSITAFLRWPRGRPPWARASATSTDGAACC